jgi:putative addiction module killer protein
MNTILRTQVYADWFDSLRDLRAKARITARIAAASAGNFGDCEPVGEGVSEMRIDFGPGYRVYFTRSGKIVYILLCGGDKSTQAKDIRRAKLLAKEL